MDRKNRRLFAGCHNKVMAVVDADTGKVLAQKKEIRREDLGKVIEEQLALKKGTPKPATP